MSILGSFAVLKNWKIALAGVLALTTVAAGLYSVHKRQEVNALQAANAVAQERIQRQQDSIEQLTVFNERLDEISVERESARQEFRSQTKTIIGELNELREINEEYARCADTRLPYRLDSMFDTTDGNRSSSDSTTTSSDGGYGAPDSTGG